MDAGRARTVCLLPVRNGAADLPGFFASARRFCDAIVALDDGSTDETAQLLADEPLVARLLRHPPRASYEGWHDAANRNELLAAAAALDPQWIISVDADERIDAGDAAALRAFLETDALPGVGYGFRCYAMAPDLSRALPNPIWVYRLFAYAPGARFPDQALHFAPIPAGIPRRAFIRTTLRIQHLGGSTPERRRARYEKYRQADPDCRFWPDYSSLLAEPEPERYRPWQPRYVDAPILYRGGAGEEISDAAVDLAVQGAALDVSIVVCGRPDAPGTRRALASAVAARQVVAAEVLLVSESAPGRDLAVDRWIEAPGGASPGALRNRGLAAATGRRVVFLDERLRLEPGALELILEAHRSGYALVTGPVVAERHGALATAAYVTEFGADRPGRPAGATDQPVRWASYDRALLMELGGFDEAGAAGASVGLHRELAWNGYLALRLDRPLLRFELDQPGAGALATTAAGAGSATARYFLSAYGDRGAVLGRAYVSERLIRRVPRRLRLARNRARRVDGRGRTAAAAMAAELAGVAGEWATLVRPGRGKALVLFGRPAGIALCVVRFRDRPPLVALVRFDLRVPRLAVVLLDPAMTVPAGDGTELPLAAALGVEPGTGAPHVSRFAAHDAIGRWLDVEIDDIAGVDGDALVQATGNAWAPRALLAWLARPSSIAWLLMKRRGTPAAVRLDWTARALLLALLRLRRIDAEGVPVVRLGRAGEPLDADDVAIARTVLEPDSLRKPRNQRESLKRVEWA